MLKIKLADFLKNTETNPELSRLIIHFSTACREIAKAITKENRSSANTKNAHGEEQLKMDKVADEIFLNYLRNFSVSELIKEYASEEQESIIDLNPSGRYSVAVDPLDGSSLLDTNLTVGTIIAIHEGALLGSADNLIAAMYVLYGPVTNLVFSIGKGGKVHEFILDERDSEEGRGKRNGGEFVLAEENIRMQERGKTIAYGGLRNDWHQEHKNYIEHIEDAGYKIRYSGCLVADVHQILAKRGGLFTYPSLKERAEGKLRLLFELEPLSFIIENAGGAGSNGIQPILSLTSRELHQRSPIYLGSKEEIMKAKDFLSSNQNRNLIRSTNQTTMNEVKNTMEDVISTQIKLISKEDVNVPADVPVQFKEEFIANYLELTKRTGRLMLFAGDQKIEHLNDDFYGESSLGPIPEDDNEPEHLFKIASQATIGCLAVQYGLVSHFGKEHPNVPYLVKINSKTHLVRKDQSDPCSKALVTVEDVIDLKRNSGLKILAVGYTIYLGSEFEKEMLSEAQRIIIDAHKHGLPVVLWIYPRGAAVKDEKCPHLIAGAAGVACCLGADFVKLNYPKKEGQLSEEAFKEAVKAAGKTKVVAAGGSSTDVYEFLDKLHKQINVSGASGNATGRNVHQKSLSEAVRMCNAISAITLGNKDVDFAMKVYMGGAEFSL